GRVSRPNVILERPRKAGRGWFRFSQLPSRLTNISLDELAPSGRRWEMQRGIRREDPCFPQDWQAPGEIECKAVRILQVNADTPLTTADDRLHGILYGITGICNIIEVAA